jgi:hypothetical protein
MQIVLFDKFLGGGRRSPLSINDSQRSHRGRSALVAQAFLHLARNLVEGNYVGKTRSTL